MSVRSFINFNVKAGMTEAFERTYREGRFLERAEVIPGFLQGEFLCLDREAGKFAATALWDSVESYHAWQEAYATAIPIEHARALMKCLEKFEPGVTFAVLNSHGNRGDFN